MLVGFFVLDGRTDEKSRGTRDDMCASAGHCLAFLCVLIILLRFLGAVSAWRMETCRLLEQVCMTFSSVVCSKLASFCYATPFLHVSSIHLAV